MAAPQFGVKYTLVGPDGTTAVFNDTTDPNYVGSLTDQSGLDSPDIRENADVLVQADGGIHGDFFLGRRPFTLTGMSFGHATASDRNARLNKLSQAVQRALRADATLSWTPAGGEQRYINARIQQPLRITGGWNKEFQIPLVAADPRIYSSSLYSSVGRSGTVLSCTNGGTVTTYPLLTIWGPGTNPTITNQTVQAANVLTLTLTRLQALVIDTLNRTVNQYSYTNLLPGSGDFEVDTSGWQAVGAATTFARQTSWASTGSGSLRVTSSGSVAANTFFGAGVITKFGVTAGHTYLVAADLNSLAFPAGSNAHFGVDWFNASNVNIGFSVIDFTEVSGTGTIYGTFTPPVGATQAQPSVGVKTGGTAGSVDMYLDNIIFADAAVTPVTKYGAIDFTQNLWWGLQPGANAPVLAYGSGSAVGSRLEVDWRNAWA